MANARTRHLEKKTRTVATKTSNKSNSSAPASGRKMSKAEQNTQERIQTFVAGLPFQKVTCTTAQAILTLIFPFLRIFMEENAFRFLLGVLSVCTPLTNKQIAICAKCSPKRVQCGRKEVLQESCPGKKQQRKKGGGRKCFAISKPQVKKEILKFVELRSYGPCTKGTQEYTAATLEGIQKMVKRKTGETISQTAIRKILRSANIRLRTNKKLLYGNEGKETTEQKAIRHLQFDYIASIREKVTDPSCIVLSIDCKKKEILGLYARNHGLTYAGPGQEAKTNEHDFMTPLHVASLKDEDDLLDRQEGKAIPYGIYDLALNKAYVAVGISHDTPEFVAASIGRFIDRIKADHPHAGMLYLLCDGGGSNNSRSDAFKFQIALLSRKIGMKIEVVHYPPYRSKFNPIERQVFAFVSKRFDRTILYNLRTVINEIKNTTTCKGLTVQAELDTGIYELKQKPTPEQMNLFHITYIGTNAKNRLSYVIDGTRIKDSDIPECNRQTVFDIKHNIDLSREEKQALKEQLAAEKAEKQRIRAEKRAQKNAAMKSQKNRRKTRSSTKAGSISKVPA